MSTRAEHEAFQAAQALCMLANTNRQERVDGDETEDEDCIITHVRPVVHRHHPYRRPEPPQQVRVPATRPGASLNNAQPPRRVQQQPCPVRQPLQQRPLPPPPPAQQQRHLPRPLPAPSQLAARHLLPLQVPVAARGQPAAVPQQARALRPLPAQGGQLAIRQAPPTQRPVVTRGPTAVQPSTPARHSTPERRPLPDRRPLSERQPLPPVHQSPPAQQPAPGGPVADGRPSPPERLHVEDGSDPLDVYSTRALALQALVAAEEGEWVLLSEIIGYLAYKYPHLRNEAARRLLHGNLSHSLRGNKPFLETKKYAEGSRNNRNVYRVAAWAREWATRLAWRPRRPRRGTGAGDSR